MPAYAPFHAAYADVQRRLGDESAASAAYERALELTAIQASGPSLWHDWPSSERARSAVGLDAQATLDCCAASRVRVTLASIVTRLRSASAPRLAASGSRP